MSAMNYESLNMVTRYMSWMIGLAAAVLTLRIVYIIYSSISEAAENSSAASIWKKVRVRVVAAIICVVIDSLIALIKSYYFK